MPPAPSAELASATSGMLPVAWDVLAACCCDASAPNDEPAEPPQALSMQLINIVIKMGVFFGVRSDFIPIPRSICCCATRKHRWPPISCWKIVTVSRKLSSIKLQLVISQPNFWSVCHKVVALCIASSTSYQFSCDRIFKRMTNTSPPSPWVG